jgi:hypothetical protein
MWSQTIVKNAHRRQCSLRVFLCGPCVRCVKISVRFATANAPLSNGKVAAGISSIFPAPPIPHMLQPSFQDGEPDEFATTPDRERHLTRNALKTRRKCSQRKMLVSLAIVK